MVPQLNYIPSYRRSANSSIPYPEKDEHDVFTDIMVKADDAIKVGWMANINAVKALLEGPLFKQKIVNKETGNNVKNTDHKKNCDEGCIEKNKDSTDNGYTTVIDNDHIIDIEEHLRTYMVKLLEDISVDGNNFGVAIQEAFLADLRNYESCLLEYFDHIYGYYFSRANIMKSVFKYPSVEDYKTTVKKYDDRQFNLLKYFMMQVRDIYICMYDHVHKNLEKLRQPRTQDGQHTIY
ncbi:hypothetical protein GJ496_005930 [Pomphorhynchus laevis]|nr:hypothetical protein GJ496_005930 [Pomphorhynchus laevis]